MKAFSFLLAFAFLKSPEAAAQGIVSTVAKIASPYGLAANAQGDLYVSGDDGIQRVDSVTGEISKVASGHGQLALDPANNIYFSDSDRIQRVDAITGIVTTAAGGHGLVFGGDGGLATNSHMGP